MSNIFVVTPISGNCVMIGDDSSNLKNGLKDPAQNIEILNIPSLRLRFYRLFDVKKMMHLYYTQY